MTVLSTKTYTVRNGPPTLLNIDSPCLLLSQFLVCVCLCFFFFFFFFFSFFFLGPNLQHMEVPRLGVQSELQLPATAKATATRNLSHNYALHQHSRQLQMPSLLREARDGSCILMDTSRIHFCCTMTGTPLVFILKEKVCAKLLIFIL